MELFMDASRHVLLKDFKIFPEVIRNVLIIALQGQ